jgi:hypothetical protein
MDSKAKDDLRNIIQINDEGSREVARLQDVGMSPRDFEIKLK